MVWGFFATLGPVLPNLFSVQFSSVQFNSVQFNSVQFNSSQFSSIQFSSVQFRSDQFRSVRFSSWQYLYSHISLFISVQSSSVQFSSVQFSCFMPKRTGHLNCCCFAFHPLLPFFDPFPMVQQSWESNKGDNGIMVYSREKADNLSL